MPYKVISLVGRVDGQLIKGNLLSDQDIIRLNDTRARIKSLETKVDDLHKFTRKLSELDFYTDATHKDSMQVGVVYMCAFKDGTFVAPSIDTTGNKFWPEGKIPDYYELVMLADDGTVMKLGREKYSSSLDDVMSKIHDNEYLGQQTHIVSADTDVAKATSVTKFNFATADANPTVQLNAGHVTQDKDGVALFSHTGTVETDGTRHAELVVNKSDGSVAGKVSLSSAKDGTGVTLTIPQPSATPADNEAATVKFVQDAIEAKPNFKYQTDKPADESAIEYGVLIFFDAVDLIQD